MTDKPISHEEASKLLEKWKPIIEFSKLSLEEQRKQSRERLQSAILLEPQEHWDMTKEPDTLVKMYAVRNREGKFYRAKGFGGSGASWVDTLAKARIYPRIGSARTQVTYFATNHPTYGIPTIVELHVTKMVTLQETERVKKAAEKRERAEAASKASWAKEEYSRAQQKLKDAQAELARIQELQR